MQLCFSLSDQEAHNQGCGLPRELVERMPVVAGERTGEREVERGQEETVPLQVFR